MMGDRSGRKLWVRFVLSMAFVSAVVCIIYFGWSAVDTYQDNERRALAEARVLNMEMNATWDYISSIQDTINYSNGVYDFKKVYCASAGRSIALRFTRGSEYSIRYVRENPRNATDEPDDFERAALRSFENGNASEYYRLSLEDGSFVFRYVSALRIDSNCLECHGGPTGEKDAVGYLKEGMVKGDLAGGASITMPLDDLMSEAKEGLFEALLFFVLLIIGNAVMIMLSLRLWITEPIMDENRHLRDESEAQSNILTIITHELKTPLSAIIAFAEILKRKSRDRAPEDVEMIEEIEANSYMLRGMIDNVLDTARMEAGAAQLSMEDLDVYDVAHLVKVSADPLARQKGVALSVFVDPNVPIVRSDSEMLRRIMLNLVSNALRFTEAGGRVDVSMKYDNDALHVVVADDGAGIPPEQLNRVFDRFSTTQGAARSGEGGTGLGLFIVKSFADMVGGSVSVESEVGSGSTFTVVLPMQACPEEEI